MIVEAHRSATPQAINEIVDAAHAAGFNNVSIRETYDILNGITRR